MGFNERTNFHFKIIDRLLLEYDVERSECEEQVMEFINLLNDDGLLILES
ncbi:PqqD family peptide modification chaperone [Metabacillus litoralis]